MVEELEISAKVLLERLAKAKTDSHKHGLVMQALTHVYDLGREERIDNADDGTY